MRVDGWGFSSASKELEWFCPSPSHRPAGPARETDRSGEPLLAGMVGVQSSVDPHSGFRPAALRTASAARSTSTGSGSSSVVVSQTTRCSLSNACESRAFIPVGNTCKALRALRPMLLGCALASACELLSSSRIVWGSLSHRSTRVVFR